MIKTLVSGPSDFHWNGCLLCKHNPALALIKIFTTSTFLGQWGPQIRLESPKTWHLLKETSENTVFEYQDLILRECGLLWVEYTLEQQKHNYSNQRFEKHQRGKDLWDIFFFLSYHLLVSEVLTVSLWVVLKNGGEKELKQRLLS